MKTGIHGLISKLKKIHPHGTRLYSSCISLNDVYILSAVRTPIGCFQGKLSSLSAVQLATRALTAAVEKSCLNKDDIQEFILGCCFQTGLGLGPAYQTAYFSGLSSSVVPSVVNKACGSGMKAVMFACQVIKDNSQEVVAAGGMESLSNVPYMLKRQLKKMGNICVPDLIFYDGLIDRIELVDITNFAEETAKEYRISRQHQDDYALNSYSKAAIAQREGVFNPEIVPVVLKDKKGEEEVVCQDEEISRLKVDKFRDLPTDVKGGTVTAGNASGLHDGAAVMILASGNYVLKKNLTPLARIVSFADANVHHRKFVLAPSVAIPKALVRANLINDDISRWEISETFAITPLVNSAILKLNPDVVNIHGGAISLGHPFGMTGARLIVHLVNVLCEGEMGCATISHGPGGASAVIVEKMSV